MKLFYIANIRIPTEKAHGIQIMNTCGALARAGAEVELVVPRRHGSDAADPFDFYKIERNFSIRKIFCVDLVRSNWLVKPAFMIQTFWFAVSAFLFVFFTSRKGDTVFYGRDEIVLAPISLFSREVFWETHVGSYNIFARVLARMARGIVGITNGLRDFYIEKGVNRDRLAVVHDAVDIDIFEGIKESQATLRKELGLPIDQKIVAYSGSLGLYSWKGVDVFLDALAHITSQPLVFLLVGGSTHDIKLLKERYSDKRIIFAGRVTPDYVARYLKASDVLVLPNKSGNPISEKFTSPMKLFEYMASGRPIIASDLPSIREVLSSDNAIIVPPNDSVALTRGIERATKGEGSALVARALVDVKKFTWTARAASIISFINRRHGRSA